MVLLSVGQHLSLWPAIKTLSHAYTKFSDVNLFFAQYFFDTSRAFQNIVAMLWVNSKWILNDTIYGDYAIKKYQTILFHR